jgi:hypothetical protein
MPVGQIGHRGVTGGHRGILHGCTMYEVPVGEFGKIRCRWVAGGHRGFVRGNCRQNWVPRGVNRYSGV